MELFRFIDCRKPNLPKNMWRNLEKFTIPDTNVICVPLLYGDTGKFGNILREISWFIGTKFLGWNNTWNHNRKFLPVRISESMFCAFKYNNMWYNFEITPGYIPGLSGLHNDTLTYIHEWCEENKKQKISILCVGPNTGKSTLEMQKILLNNYNIELDLYAVDPEAKVWEGAPERCECCTLNNLPVTRKYDIVFWEAWRNFYGRNDIFDCISHLKDTGILLIPSNSQIRMLSKQEAIKHANALLGDTIFYIWDSILRYNFGRGARKNLFEELDSIDNFWDKV